VLLAPLAFGHPLVRARRGLTAIATVGALTATIFIGLSYADRFLYRLDRPWDEYARYNAMLAQLFEWSQPSSDRVDGMRAAAGWSQNDWDMVPAMWAVDANLHGFERLSRAYEVSGANTGDTLVAAVPALLQRAAGLASTDLGRVIAEAGYVLAAAFVLAVAYGSRRGVMLSASSIILFCAVCIGIEAAFRALPFRLLAPIHACLMMAAIVTVASVRRPASAVAGVLAFSVVATILVQQAAIVAPAVAAGLRHMKQVDAEVAGLRDLRPSLIVRHADTFPAEFWWRPFHRPAFEIPSVALGWNNQNPLLQQFLTSTGRQPLLRAICHDPSIVVVAARPDRLEPVVAYMQEHFGETVAWTRVAAGSFATWRCTSDRSTGEASPAAGASTRAGEP
jgi:hypothetical protein